MSQRIEVTYRDKEIVSFLKKLKNNTDQYRKRKKRFFQYMSAIIYADIIDHFEKERGQNRKWAPRKEPYKTRIESKGKSKILQVTGRLRQGFMPIKTSRNMRSVSEGIEWFNAVPYARVHDEGSKRMPKREYMWLSDRAMIKLSEETLKKIIGE